MRHDDILRNRAHLTKESGDTTSCQSCGSEVIFALRDNHHEFSMSLSTLLQCLHFAEQEGLIPPVDTMWWSQVTSRYCLVVPDNLTTEDSGIE